jgi:hypothetical protein
MALADLNCPASVSQTPLKGWLTWGGRISIPAVLMMAIAYLFFPGLTVERPQDISTPLSSSSPTPTLISNPIELKTLENLVLLATVQGRQYPQKGTFLTEFSMEPAVPQYQLHLIPLQRNGLQIMAQPKVDELKSFIVLLWGGPRSAQLRQRSKSDRSNPWDEFPLASVPVTNGQSSFTAVMNYCQSDRPTRELPATVLLPKTEPAVYQDFRCPSGYGFAASMTEIVGRLAVQTLPSFVFKNPNQ